MYADEPNQAIVWIWEKIATFLYQGIVYLLFPISFGIIYEGEKWPAARNVAIYLDSLVIISTVGLFAFEKFFSRTELHAAITRRAENFPGLFLTEVVLLGFAPASVMAGWLSLTVFGVYFGAVLLFSLIVLVTIAREEGSSGGLLAFLNAAVLSFYLGLAPLYLGIFLWTYIQRLYQYLHGTYGMSVGRFGLLAAMAGVELTLNLLLLFFLAESRDLSGAYEPSFSARWVTIHTKEFVRHATRAEAGEWSPPMRALPKFVLVNGALAAITFFAVSKLGHHLPIEARWKYVVSYTILLLLAVAWYFVKARRLKNA